MSAAATATHAFELRLERDRFHPGELVRGWVAARSPQQGNALEAFLRYLEKTSDFEDVTLGVRSGPLAGGALPPGQWLPFALALPPFAPPAVESPHGRMSWEVAVRLERSFGPDEHVRLPIVVASGAGPAEGWYTDPSGRHERRWWDGSRWTERVQ